MSSGPEDFIGQVLQETYRFERVIGLGGMGVVYEASHLRLARRFAIKLLSSTFAEDAGALARFQREALVTSALGHPNILEVIDFNKTPGGTAFIIMELLDGESLAARLDRAGPLPLRKAAAIVSQVASALHAAHQRGVIHRDLKPHNIFLCRREERDDFVKVVDFGASKVAGAGSFLTGTHALIGTPAYMSPEQAEQKVDELDSRSDIYSLGVVLFEMLAGRTPFAADSIPQLLFKVAYHEPPSLRSIRGDLPEAVERVLSRAMAKRPADRFATALELSEAFAAAVSGVEEAGETGPTRPPATERAALVDRRSGGRRRPATAPGSQSTLTSGTGELLIDLPRPGRRTRLAILAGLVILVGLSTAGLLLLLGPRRSAPGPASETIGAARPGGDVAGAMAPGSRPAAPTTGPGQALDPKPPAVDAAPATVARPDARPAAKPAMTGRSAKVRFKPKVRTKVPRRTPATKHLGDGIVDYK